MYDLKQYWVPGDSMASVSNDAGELFTFGRGSDGRLDNTGHTLSSSLCRNELVPMLVEALAGENVVAAAGDEHTAVWTDAGELFTFVRSGMESLGSWGTEWYMMSTCRGMSRRSRMN